MHTQGCSPRRRRSEPTEWGDQLSAFILWAQGAVYGDCNPGYASLLAAKPGSGMILGFDESGVVRHNLQDSTGSVAITTGARWHEGRLYIGSLQEPDVIIYDLN